MGYSDVASARRAASPVPYDWLSFSMELNMTRTSLTLLALAVSAVPLSAQISTTDRVRDRVIIATGGRVDTRADARTGETRRTSDARASRKVPPGHLPPRGMCRVWIDGAAPGKQPPVTSCTQAEQDRLRHGVHARVIYGDRESFRGRANGKFKNREQRECQLRDAVVVDGRVVNVCSDDRGQGDRRGTVLGRRGVGDDDRDEWKKREKSERKLDKDARKAARKHGRG